MLTNGSLFGGGAEHVIAVLARHLRELGHRVTIAVIHRGGEVKNELERDGFEIVTELAKGAGLSTWKRIRSMAHERGVDVVHTHDLRSLTDVAIARMRGGRFAHAHTFHFGNYPHLPRKQLLLEGLFARVPDRLFAVGEAQRRTILKALWLPDARLITVRNGVDYESAVPLAAPEPEGGAPVLGSVSTFGLQKGLPTLLDAAGVLRQRGLSFKLMLVGEGGMRAELEAQAARLGLSDCVEFTGWRPDAATALLPTFNIFVQSSYWEAMSIVILEAMAARRPIVATTVGENPSVLEDGRSAVLVPPRNVEALANGMAALITDRRRREQLAAGAYDAYQRHYTGRAMTERYQAEYAACLSRRWPAAGGAQPAVGNASGSR